MTSSPEEAQLDPSLNIFPDNVRHVHFMGICGTGMAAMAGMLKNQGYHVTGSDSQVYPPMSIFLSDCGIDVMEGYGPQNFTHRPDLAIVGNVITRKNLEAQALAESRVCYLSFPQLLSHVFLAGKKSLVVAGTHGKTTTSSMLATMLHGAGYDPGFMIGGIVQAFGKNFRIGQGDFFVVEGDEYDTAFFDKGPKFLHYQPHIAIITSIEFDHADIYADLEAVKASFRKLVAIMPVDGCIVANLDDPVVREVVADAPCVVVGYGEQEQCQWQLRNVQCSRGGSSFTAHNGGSSYGEFKSVMPGRHNCLNSLAVIAVLDRLGLQCGVIATRLAAFQGVRRRQEVRGVVGGVTVIDDFAHHPTSVRETLAALRAAYAGQRLVTVFEPRTNSSRRRVFQNDYALVFDATDVVLIKEPDALIAVPEDERFSSAELVEVLQKRGVDARYFPDTGRILDYLAVELRSGDVVAILSNGGFDNIHEQLLSNLS